MASDKEKLTGALSRIRTCDPPLRRRMLYPTELPGHRDIVPEPKECPINVQPVPSRHQARNGTLNQNPRCIRSESSLSTANNQPRKGLITRTYDVSDQHQSFSQPITSQERDTNPEPKVYDQHQSCSQPTSSQEWDAKQEPKVSYQHQSCSQQKTSQ